MKPVDEAEDTFRVLTTDLFATRETILIANFKPPLRREDSLADWAAISKFSLRPPFAVCNVRVCDLMKTSPESRVPLCVDLDGTLINTDVTLGRHQVLAGAQAFDTARPAATFAQWPRPFQESRFCSIDRESRFAALAEIADRMVAVRSRRRTPRISRHGSGRRLFAGSHGAPRILHGRSGKRWRFELEGK